MQSPVIADDSFTARDGTVLPLRHWDAEKPRAIVIALHGMSDYSNAFDTPARAWAESGITTFAYDQRGFGRGPNPGLWAGAAAMRADLRDCVAAARARYPGVPVFALGESMGGAVVLSALASDVPPAIDGAILVAPAVWSRSDMPLSYRAALFLAAHLMPGLVLSNNAASSVVKIMPSDNVPMLRALGRDPLFQKRTRIDTLYGLVDLMDGARRAPAALTAPPPILFLYGRNDQVIPPKPTEAVIAALGTRATVHRYDQGYHMLLRDLDGGTVAKDAADWMLATKAVPDRYAMAPPKETAMTNTQKPDLRNGKPGENAGSSAKVAGHQDRVLPTTDSGEHAVNPGIGSKAGVAEGQVTKSN
jgi:acylglycerol lipase